jgi:hypothetical protein
MCSLWKISAGKAALDVVSKPRPATLSTCGRKKNFSAEAFELFTNAE